MLQTFLQAGGAARAASTSTSWASRTWWNSCAATRPTCRPSCATSATRTRGEDPVIHFYEHFLAAYDKKLKVQRGVFYTPQPVVSYIVRSVHELLQTEFGLEDGLAATVTWGEMAQKQPGPEMPPLTDEAAR